MSLGKPGSYGSDTRDPEADFAKAYEEEYRLYASVGQVKKAAQVAQALRDLNLPVPNIPGVKECAVNDDAETAVDTPKRRGRPPVVKD